MECPLEQKLYIVRKGRNPGIYMDWATARKQVEGFPFPEFRLFGQTEFDKIQKYMAGENLIDGKYFAVKCGRQVGVYNSWDQMQRQIIAFPHATYAGFSTEKEAYNFLGIKGPDDISSLEMRLTEFFSKKVDVANVYVDGSFCQKQLIYSASMVVIKDENLIYEQSKNGHNRAAAIELQSTAGELSAAMMAAHYAVNAKKKKLFIYHDNLSISNLLSGMEKSKSDFTKKYIEYMQNKIKNEQLEIQFIKVKAHSNNKWNNHADSLAKKVLQSERLKAAKQVNNVLYYVSPLPVSPSVPSDTEESWHKTLRETEELLAIYTAMKQKDIYQENYKVVCKKVQNGQTLSDLEIHQLGEGLARLKKIHQKFTGFNTAADYRDYDAIKGLKKLHKTLLKKPSIFREDEANFIKSVYVKVIAKKHVMKLTHRKRIVMLEHELRKKI